MPDKLNVAASGPEAMACPKVVDVVLTARTFEANGAEAGATHVGELKADGVEVSPTKHEGSTETEASDTGVEHINR